MGLRNVNAIAVVLRMLLVALCALGGASRAQTAITGLIASYRNNLDPPFSYILGINVYTFNFGIQNDLILEGVLAASRTFSVDRFADRVELRRVPISGIPSARQLVFFERAPLSSNRIYRPAYVGLMEEALLGPVINRGADNVFAHQGDVNVNNIQRIDYIFDSGIVAPDYLTEIGFVILERGGNDPFRIALITALDGSGNPASYSAAVSALPANWGLSGFNIATDVLRSNVPGQWLERSASLSSQPIAGIVFTFDQFGITPGTTVYGYSLVAGDAPADSSQWLNLGAFPTNTNSATQGGLDLISGGALIVSDRADLAISKAASLVGPEVNDVVTYTLTVTNRGPAPATNVVATDVLPFGVAFISASAACSEVSGVVTCIQALLEAGDTATFDITVSVLAQPLGTAITNTATVSADEIDPNSANNSASATVTVSGLLLTKTVCNLTDAGGDCADSDYQNTVSGAPGDVLSYRVRFERVGTPIQNLVITDDVPAHTTLALDSFGPGGDVRLVCPDGSEVLIPTGPVSSLSVALAVHCGAPGGLNDGEVGYLEFRVRID